MGESFMLADMSMRSDLDASLFNSASKVLMKGLRDMGLLPALVGVLRAGELRAGDGMAGDAARLRNGLLEGRFSDRPGEGRRSGDKGVVISGFRFRHQCPT